MTKAPAKRDGSYRDPSLSDRWLAEAEARALGSHPKLNEVDAKKIILRLVQEVRDFNAETGR